MWKRFLIAGLVVVIVVSLFMIIYEIITPESYSIELSESIPERDGMGIRQEPVEIIIVEPEQSFSKALFGWIGTNLIGIISLVITLVRDRKKKSVHEVNA